MIRRISFFYDILKKKFLKPCFQTILSREFDYNKKVKVKSDKNVAEFNN